VKLRNADILSGLLMHEDVMEEGCFTRLAVRRNLLSW
jgi:hypothetical protein